MKLLVMKKIPGLFCVATSTLVIAGLVLAGAATGAANANAGQVTIVNRFGSFQVKAKSLQEKGWDRVVRQQYDYSCGSAAVATLLT